MRQASRGVPAAWLLAAACALTAAVGVGASTFTELTYTVVRRPAWLHQRIHQLSIYLRGKGGLLYCRVCATRASPAAAAAGSGAADVRLPGPQLWLKIL